MYEVTEWNGMECSIWRRDLLHYISRCSSRGAMPPHHHFPGVASSMTPQNKELCGAFQLTGKRRKICGHAAGCLVTGSPGVYEVTEALAPNCRWRRHRWPPCGNFTVKLCITTELNIRGQGGSKRRQARIG